MLRAIAAHSDDIDSDDAIGQVLADCARQLRGETPRAGLLFCAAEFDHALILDRVNHAYPGLQLIGCTTDGEMSSGGFSEDAVSLLLFVSDEVEFAAGYGSGAGGDPESAVGQALAMAGARLPGAPRLALTLPDGLTASAPRLLAAFDRRLGAGVPVVGGMSADRVGGCKTEFTTRQFCGRELLSDAVPVLLLGGRLLYALGVESGWQPVGRIMTVTRSTSNTVHELDGRPALECYSHYLGRISDEHLAGLGSYPLAIHEPGADRFYLRVPRSADPESGSIGFLGEVPEGARVQITQAVRDQVVDGARRAARAARRDYPGRKPDAALMFSCTGRKIALGTRTAEEVRLARESLPGQVPVCGFYTFGEIGPVARDHRARYHNTTFVTLLLGVA